LTFRLGFVVAQRNLVIDAERRAAKLEVVVLCARIVLALRLAFEVGERNRTKKLVSPEVDFLEVRANVACLAVEIRALL